jgi:ATP-dependent helicase Lhr and Lhr-like helicase
MEWFGPATRAWFESAFDAPTAVQAQGWPRIAAGEHALLIAPTGSGKTLAAFLWCIDRLIDTLSHARPGHGLDGAAEARGVRVVYVSPLKALVYDVERNLGAPLRGIGRAAEQLGATLTLPRVAVRTGDTSDKARRKQARNPAEILVTTPESLYLMLGSQVRETLRSVDTIIVDEVHALAPTKRGAHLALSLERLAHLTGRDPQRIGLSATARPVDEVARFLAGDRPVRVVDASAPPALDLAIVVPVADMTRPHATASRPPGWPKKPDDEPGGERDGERDGDLESPPQAAPRLGMWPAIYPHLLADIRAHRSTIIFVNSRGLCERLTHQLNELAGEELVRAHHGSLSHKERQHIEEMLKSGRLAGIVATSSLELGIDMDAVDLVVLVESPGAAARGLQRIGRAGHGVGRVSKGKLYPRHRGDLLEAAVVAAGMRAGEIEALSVPQNPLDVLAQQIVAAVAVEPWPVAALERMVTRAASFRDLPGGALRGVLDMLAGRYPSSAFASLTPRIVWDRETDVLTPRRGARMLALVSGGTIPDRGTYAVHLGEDGPRVGELDEEMVHETHPGDLFTLGASTWRVEGITRDRVIVSPAPGEAGKLPFWRGDGPGRPAELGRAMGAFVRELDDRLAAPGEHAREAAGAWLEHAYGLDALAAHNLVEYVSQQRQATGTVPTDRRITVERFRDELGDWRVCILSHFGARVHAAWALALQARLTAAAGFEAKTMWSNEGIVLRFAGADELPALDMLIPDADDVRELVIQELGRSALFAGQFRENAARALLMPRQRPGQRTPLWVQRLKAQELLAVAREFSGFPIVMETYRSCLQDVLDLGALAELCRAMARREVRVDLVETRAASPFARSLVFAYVAAFLYEGDAPLAERKAQALSLDRQLLRELLGQEELRELLDPEVIDALEAELQALAPERQARHAGGLHDVLRRVGDLSESEVAARCQGDHQAMLEELVASRRAVLAGVAGQQRWVAIEDVALVRDALGADLPPGVPEALLGPYGHDPDRAGNLALDALLGRWSRTHGPFLTQDLCDRYGLSRDRVDATLAGLRDRGQVVDGAFRPGASSPGASSPGAGQPEWCDADILRRIKRRTLARLRNQVAPVDASRLGLLLPAWHQIAEPGRGLGRLQEAIVQLEGLPLSYSELEQVILPARVSDFSPRMLDELGAMGWLVWVGCGALGKRDGRIALYRRDRVAALLEPAEAAEAGTSHESVRSNESARSDGFADAPSPVEPVFTETHGALLAHLGERGASFLVALQSACAPRATEVVLAALWDLVWAGLVTNDTFQPLRAHGRKRSSPGPRKRPDRGALQMGGGRWSLVRDLVASPLSPTSPTERAHGRALKLLERHGIVSREVAALEPLTGGFSAVYQILKAMEEAGKVRRGYFVEGLGGAQFAYPGVIDRLRALSPVPGKPAVLVLSAVDPANPYGWLLPWPEREPGEAPARRAAGAAVILVDGQAALYVDKGGRRLLTFIDDRDTVIAAARALDRVAARKRGKTLRIETIDGQPARVSPHAAAFIEAGFFADPHGLMRELRLFEPA